MQKLQATHGFRKRALALVLISPFVLFHFSLDTAEAGSKSATAKEILDGPYSYQLVPVTLNGKVTNLKKLAPHINRSGHTCSNAHTFMLTDETGSILVYLQGSCGVFPPPVPPEVNEGETV